MTAVLKTLLPLPAPAEMRRWDQGAVALGLPEFSLMENAARAALGLLREMCGPLRHKQVLLFMGSGNNGGDAACLARHLLDAEAQPLLLHLRAKQDYPEDSAAGQHLRLAAACGVPLRHLPAQDSSPPADLWQHLPQAHILVDGLLGTGFEGQVRESLRLLTAHINERARSAAAPLVLALDVPSGLNALSGQASPDTVRAQATVCFAAAKPGLVLPEARPYTGQIVVRGIGIPQSVQTRNPAGFHLLDGHCAALLPPLPPVSYKNAFGHVLVVGGSPGLTGAAHLTALAALRSGAGLVSVATAGDLCTEVKGGLADIMTVPLGQGTQWPAHMPPALALALRKASALVVGPGMGRSPEAASLLQALLAETERPPALLDADALNILAEHPRLLALLQANDILTPHPGEAARLLGMSSAQVQEDRVQALRRLTALAPCVWVLKGAGTLVARSGSPLGISPYDVPTLAVAGSGDVLAGCAAALLGQQREALPAALLAVATHIRAGYILYDTHPLRGNLASDIAHALPAALASLAQLPEICRVDM